MKDFDRNAAFALPQGGRGDDLGPRWQAPLKPFAVPNAPPRSRLDRGWLWALAAIWLLTLSIFAFRHFISGVEPASSGSDGLGLGAERNGGALTMTWDVNSPAVREARKGVLSIVDGGDKKAMDLDAVQLRHGHVLYSPDTDDVSFELELLTPRQGPVTESLRVVDPAPARLPARAYQPPPSRPAMQARKNAATREFVPETARRVPRWEPPADMTKAQPQPPVILQPPKPTGAASVVQQPQLPASVNPPPVSAPPGQAAFANQPSAAKPAPQPFASDSVGKASGYSGPRAIHQASPTVPQNMRSFITRDTNVEVKVSIDAAGKVTHAETLSSGNPYLSKLSANTATLWQFEPAKVNGRNVPSEMKLVFRYRAGAR
jgi:outer membrane biosynthesis protein TonB